MLKGAKLLLWHKCFKVRILWVLSLPSLRFGPLPFTRPRLTVYAISFLIKVKAYNLLYTIKVAQRLP